MATQSEGAGAVAEGAGAVAEAAGAVAEAAGAAAATTSENPILTVNLPIHNLLTVNRAFAERCPLLVFRFLTGNDHSVSGLSVSLRPFVLFKSRARCVYVRATAAECSEI